MLNMYVKLFKGSGCGYDDGCKHSNDYGCQTVWS